MVIMLSPSRPTWDISDVPPIAPWTETPAPSSTPKAACKVHAVVKPLGEARPAWKVLRVLGNMLGLPGFEYESASEVLADARGADDAQQPLVQGQAAVQQDVQGRWKATPTQAGCRFHLPARFHRAPRGLAAAHGHVRAAQQQEVTA